MYHVSPIHAAREKANGLIEYCRKSLSFQLRTEEYEIYTNDEVFTFRKSRVHVICYLPLFSGLQDDIAAALGLFVAFLISDHFQSQRIGSDATCSCSASIVQH